MRKLVKWLSVAAMALPIHAAHSGISDNEVRIGLITDLSSVFRGVGYVADIAAEMAIEDFGGKVLGKPIRLYVRDHKLDPEVAMEVAKDLHENHKVDAFLEMVGTNVAIPLQKYAAENNILALHTGAGAGVLTGALCSPVGVHWVWDTHAVAAGTAAALTKPGDTWFFITADYAFGKLLQADATTVVERLGGKVIGSASHPFKAADYTAQLLEAQASGANVIALANAGDETVAAISQAYELGIMGGEQTVAALFASEQTAQQLGPYIAGGVKLTTAFYWNMDDETRAWGARFRARSGARGTMFSVGIYSVVLHYLKAIEAAGTDEPKAVIAKMREMPVNDVFARNGRLRPDGRMVHDMYLAEIKNAQDSRLHGDFFNIVQVIPGDKAFKPMEEGGCPLVAKR
jgi:branched-chain amino acid transport system substrate-binding protein